MSDKRWRCCALCAAQSKGFPFCCGSDRRALASNVGHEVKKCLMSRAPAQEVGLATPGAAGSGHAPCAIRNAKAIVRERRREAEE